MIDEGGLPAMLYHIPSRGSSPIEVETVARVAAAEAWWASRRPAASTASTRLLRRRASAVFSGDDGLTLPMMALGAVGVVSVASNVRAGPGRPRWFVRWPRATWARPVRNTRR